MTHFSQQRADAIPVMRQMCVYIKKSIPSFILPVNYIITKQAELYNILPLLDLLTKLCYYVVPLRAAR